GLSGFAFSAIAACVLWLLPPLQAVPLIMLLSARNQLLSVGTLRNEMVLRRTAEREGGLAYSAGGVVGVPVGLGLLQALPTRTFAGGLGITQPYILTLQLISLSILALTHAAIFNAQFWVLLALTLPAVLLGSWTGVSLYRRA